MCPASPPCTINVNNCVEVQVRAIHVRLFVVEQTQPAPVVEHAEPAPVVMCVWHAHCHEVGSRLDMVFWLLVAELTLAGFQ